mmetsp:Transcript_52365/g.131548  ORF Transcript_52365/g.131548 Transcript_52365/m.131548 type:complete len:465 (-) Transcript_52365:50-1444(-)
MFDSFFDPLAESLGFPAQTLKYLVCMLSTYPLAFFFARVHMPIPMKHLFSIVVSMFFMVFGIGPWEWVIPVASSVVVYLLLILCPRTSSHRIVFLFSMTVIVACHIYLMLLRWISWDLDFTGVQMILTIKLSSIGYNLYDGYLGEKQPDPYKRAHAIKALPTPLEYFGWLFFFPSFLTGPAIEYTEYRDYINLSMFPNKTIPSTFIPAMRPFAIAMVLFPCVAVAPSLVPPTYMITAEFGAQPFYWKIGYMWLSMCFCRFKYYYAWKISEGASNACGVGYRVEKTKEGASEIHWDRAVNVSILPCEFPENFHQMSKEWNVSTAKWLKNYVYDRLAPPPPARPPFHVTLATYAVSALWHGLFPGYYFFFIFAAFGDNLGRSFRRKLRPYFLGSSTLKKFYDVAGIIVTTLTLSYAATTFVLLGGYECYDYLKNMYFIGHLEVLLAIVIMMLVPSPHVPQKFVKVQ